MANRYLPRYRTTRIELPAQRTLFDGVFRCEAYRAIELMNGNHIEIPGTRRFLGEHENIITNNGLDHIGQNNAQYSAYCHVGTGNAAESASDTTLDTFVASAGKSISYGWLIGGYLPWAQPTPPYYGSCQVKYRFTPNFAPGAVNIAEMGLSPQATTGDLFNRTLIKTGGTPTTIAVAADEYFDVYYTLRAYSDHVDYTTGATDDGTGSFDIGATTHGYTIRAAVITDARFHGYQLFSGFKHSNVSQFFTQGTYYAPTATLGPVTGGPSSTVDSDGIFYTQPHSIDTYTDSTYTNTLHYGSAIDDNNMTGGIEGMLLYTSMTAYQLVLDTPILKTGSNELDLVFRGTWARKDLT